MSNRDIAVSGADTLPKIMARNFQQYSDRAKALRHKQFGIWKVYTWNDFYEHVKALSLGLISLGLERNDNVSIIGENAPEWIWSELAAQSAGAVATGILPNSAPSEVSHIIENANSIFLVVEGQEQVDKILMLKEKHELTRVSTIIYWNPKGLRTYNDPVLISYRKVQDLGKEYEKEHPGIFEENIASGKGGDAAILVPTSATSGSPKGISMTHDTLLAGGMLWSKSIPLHNTDEYVSFASLAWASEQYFTVSAGLQSAFKLNFAEEPDTIQADMKEVSPNIAIHYPRYWENIASRVQSRISEAGRFNKLVYSMFLPIRYKSIDINTDWKKAYLFWRALSKIVDLILCRPIRDTFGMNRIRLAVTLGSMLNEGTFRMLRVLGIDLRQCYALSETGLVTLHKRNEVEYQSVGALQPGIDMRISDDGEILVGGQSLFSEYQNDTDSTRKVLTGKWFHTGDSGAFDEEGRLILTGKMADLIKVNGQTISLEYIESRLKFGPYIRDAFVIGGRDKPYITALLLIDFENVGSWAQKNKLSYTTLSDLSQKPEVYDLIERYLRETNQALPPYFQISRYCHLHREFVFGQELTRNGKLRRQFTEELYHDLIDALYSNSNSYNVYKIQNAMNHTDKPEGTLDITITIRSVVDGRDNETKPIRSRG